MGNKKRQRARKSMQQPWKWKHLCSLSSIRHNYYYFVADCKGKTYLSKDANEHYNTINNFHEIFLSVILKYSNIKVH